MVAIVKTKQELDDVLKMKGEPHIVLHNRSAEKIVENLKESCNVSSSGKDDENSNSNIQKIGFNSNTQKIGNAVINPMVDKAKATSGGNPQPKKRSMKRKKPKKKGAAARKTQMKIKQKKTRNKIKKQMRKTKRKR